MMTWPCVLWRLFNATGPKSASTASAEIRVSPRWLLAFVVSVLACTAVAQPFAPVEVGTTVQGFQDDFEGSTLNPAWVAVGATVFSQSGGSLQVNTASGDPNHLLYETAGYDSSVQEVLARIRIQSAGTGDQVRGGVGTAIDGGTSQGINYLLRNNNSEGQTGMHMAFLDDMRAWGPGQAFSWQLNTWYWVRLRHEPNAASQGGTVDVFAKIWAGDGSQPEPANWQLTWDYSPTRTARAGYAGITASSSGGVLQFEVDYILIKAAGLPSIEVTPSAFVQIPVSITNQPQSQAVTELYPVRFSVGAGGIPRPSYQWYKNNAAIAGATNAAYTIPSAAFADNGAQFKVVAQNIISNITYSATSSLATLTVFSDTTPPVLVGAQSLGLTYVQASFSERVASDSATNLANYTLTGANGAVGLIGASLDPSQTNVLLTVTPMSDGASYILTVNDVTDQSHLANPVAPNSQAQFVAGTFAWAGIGAPTPAGGFSAGGNGWNISGGGSGVGGTNDQFQFSYQRQTGDFDVKVRLDSLSLADAWSEAGLLAREDLSAGARCASVVATPSISGCYFQSRSATNGSTALSGSFPVNYPNTWLRLKRAGNLFTGYAGFDGVNWKALGSATLNMGPSLFLGFAVSSSNPGQLTTAAFRDFTTVTNAGVSGAPPFEPLGQCSRRTSLVISEIMYHPTNAVLEFIEIFNSRGEFADLSGYRIAGSVDYTFPAGTILPGGGFLVVAKSPTDLQNVYGITGVLGPFTNNLPNDNGTVKLLNQAGGVFLEVNYSDRAPWPVAADGAGHSLVLARASYGENNPLAWAVSDAIGGSPGKVDPFTPDPLRNVVINEFLAHTDPPDFDYIELYNHSSTAVNLSGAVLTDDAATNKFLIPNGTVIPAGGFVYYTELVLGFALNAAGETIYFKNPTGTRVIDAVRFEGQENGVATGRFPNGADQFYRLASKSPGAANTAILTSDVVINELMYHPISEDADDQFIELYNQGQSAVNLGGWALADAVSFTFPTNILIPAGSYLVVARSVANLLTKYPNLNSENAVGNFSGKLAGSGERLALTKPDTVVSTNSSGALETNLIHIAVDEVTYGTGGRWPQWADGGGSSLELTDPRSNHRLAGNWADSDETHKAQWSVVSASGTIDNGSSAADQIQILLQGPGECLVDDVQVITPGGSNLVANSTFEAGASGWTAEGTESLSSLETSEGYNSTRSFHIRAVARGDNQVNRVRSALAATLASGTTNVTIRAAVRWLKGHPEVLFRLRGNSHECVGAMALPIAAGTPGARNSRWNANAPPAIYAVQHTPVLPAANEAVLVTARAHHPRGLGSVVLRYRLDPAATYASVPMTDDGQGGDAVAGDGIYSALIPGQSANTLVAFYVQATDASTQPGQATFPADAPNRECLVRFGEVQPTGNFPVYRIWMTQATQTTWANRSKLNNSPLDVTFVLNGDRAFYNAQALYAGSPYIAPGYGGPTSGRCGYTVNVPPDDLFLGETDHVLDWPGGHGNETTAMQEEMGYWIADRLNLPFSHRWIIRLHVNGVTDEARQAVFEAVQQPAKGFVEQWSPKNPDGQFFKVERAFEFSDAGGLIADPEPRLVNYTTTGAVKKREKYRWNFAYRGGNRVNDYTNIFGLVDALNATAPEPYTSATTGQVDVEEWMRMFAIEHIIVNFDAYGHVIGKNMYAFLPKGGKWSLYMFDLDWLMLAATNFRSDYAASTAPLFEADDPTIVRMYGFAPFLRAYWGAVQDAVNGPLLAANCEPVMDAKYRSLAGNRISWCDGKALTDPAAVKTWFSQRRTYLQSQLATVAAPFAVNSSIAITNGLGRLTGTAPVGISVISVNGLEWNVTWNNVNSWSALVPLQPGNNRFSVVGLNSQHQPVTGTNTVATVYSGSSVSPAGRVVINEISPNGPLPGAEFVELFNTSPDTAFDLSGWTFNGLGYTFASGTSIGPRGFLLLVKDRVAFDMAYGSALRVLDEFPGNLQLNGETLSLIKAGVAPAPELVVDRVRYETNAPWPSLRGGRSLQVIDATQERSRVGNWASATATPGATNSVVASLPAFPTVWLNELQAENLTGLTDNFGERDPWVELFNPGTNAVSLAGLYLGTNYAAPTLWPFAADATIGPGQFLLVWADGQVQQTTASALHSSFRLSPGNGSVALTRLIGNTPQVVDYLNYAALPVNYSYGDVPDAQPFYRQAMFHPTPAGTNNSILPPITVSINEWMAENTGSLYNPATGKYDDWFELYNPSDAPAELAGYYLTDTLTNQFQYEIPAGFRVPARGFLLVWADNATSANTNTSSLHVPFKLSKEGEAIGFFAPDGSAIDAVVFGPQSANIAEGRYPDGGALRLFLPTPSPAGPNILPPAEEPPAVTGFAVTPEGAVTLAFSASPGHSYRVEFKDDLSAPNWSALGADLFATTVQVQVNDANPASAQRFYRIVQLD